MWTPRDKIPRLSSRKRRRAGRLVRAKRNISRRKSKQSCAARTSANWRKDDNVNGKIDAVERSMMLNRWVTKPDRESGIDFKYIGKSQSWMAELGGKSR